MAFLQGNTVQQREGVSASSGRQLHILSHRNISLIAIHSRKMGVVAEFTEAVKRVTLQGMSSGA